MSERGDEVPYGEPNEISAWYFAQLDRLYTLYGRPAVKRHFFKIQQGLVLRRNPNARVIETLRKIA